MLDDAEARWTGTRPGALAAWYEAVENGVLLKADSDGDAVADLVVFVQGVDALSRDDVFFWTPTDDGWDWW